MSAYRITEVGFEKTEAIFFRTTIEMASDNDISNWLWVDDNDADVILINSDIDESTLNNIINKPRQPGISPILIYCSSNGKMDDSFSYMLKKPITYTTIINLLPKLESKLASVEQTEPGAPEQLEPNTTELPELSTAEQLEPNTTELPELSIAEQLEPNTTELPELSTAEQLEPKTTELPVPSTAEQLEPNTTELPELSTAEQPEPNTTDLPELSTAEQLEPNTTELPNLSTAEQSEASSVEQQDNCNEEQQSSSSLHETVTNDATEQNTTHSLSDTHTNADDQTSIAHPGNIVDSDYDIYELLLDSDFEQIQPEDSSSQDAKSQPPEIDQNTTPVTSRLMNSHSIVVGPARRFLEERRFLGLIRKSVLLGHPTEITHYIFPPVRIYPEKNIYAHMSSHGLSPDIFTSQAAGFSKHKLEKDVDLEPPEDWSTKPLWLLFYLATLYGSEGRLRENSSVHDRLSLISQPDFNMVPDHTDYRKIVDFMTTNEPQDLNAIADGSGINIDTVVDFCNACEEINIIERTPATDSEIRMAENLIPKQNQEQASPDEHIINDKGLFKRFISKFKHSGQG